MRKLTAVNNSRLTMAAQCLTKFRNYYLLDLVDASVPASALSYGTAVHAGLERLYEGAWDVERAVEAVREALPPGHDDLCKPEETSGAGEALLRRYAEVYADDMNSIEEVISIEGEMTGDIGLPMPFAGRVDLITKEAGKYWLWDHKTLSKYSNVADHTRKQEISWQFPLYWKLCEVNGIELAGVKLNVLRKLAVPKKWVDYNPFWREVLPITQDRVLAVLNQAQRLVAEIDFISTYPTKPVRQNPSACVSNFGVCPYLRNCMGLPLDSALFDKREEDYVDLLDGRNA